MNKLFLSAALRVFFLPPVCLLLILGPAMPVAHAVLTTTPHTLGTGSIAIRSYRPDLDSDSDDNGILDWIQLADGRSLDGVWTPELAIAQRDWLAANPGNPTGPTTSSPAQQEKAALQAVLDANDGGPPPSDADHDGFSDYEETFKRDQLVPAGMTGTIDPGAKTRHPPAYRYAIIDLGAIDAYDSSVTISPKNGWVLLNKFHWDGTVQVSRFGATYDVPTDKLYELAGSISQDGVIVGISTVPDVSLIVYGPDGSTYAPRATLPYGNFNDTGYDIVPYTYDIGTTTNAVLTTMIPDSPQWYFSGERPLLASIDTSASALSHLRLSPLVDAVGNRRAFWYTLADENLDDAWDYLMEMVTTDQSIFSASPNEAYVTRGNRWVKQQAVRPTSLCFHAVSDDGIGSGSRWGLSSGPEGRACFLDTAAGAEPTALPHEDPTVDALRKKVLINSPADPRLQVIVSGHQLWRRNVDPASPVAFSDPDDLRHLIEFSEPWLDLNATGVSAEGFIVGIGKKVKGTPHGVTASEADVAKYKAAGLRITAKDWEGKPAYGPVSPDKCGLWDHDLAHYEARNGQPKQYEEHAFMLVPLALRTDADRNGAITGDGSDTLGAGIPWRFWVNDDSDRGDYAEGDSDVPGVPMASRYDHELGETVAAPLNNEDVSSTVPLLHIHGRTDLADWFPVYIDGKPLLDANDAIPGNPIRLAVLHPDEGIHATYGDMDPDKSIEFQIKELDPKFGLGLSEPKHTASAFKPPAALHAATPTIPSGLAIAIKAKRGHVIVDGIKETRLPLKIAVIGKNHAGAPVELAAVRLPLAVKKIFDPGDPSGPNNFFRWINLRDICAKAPVRRTNIAAPINRPDSETNGNHVVLVHGFNVDEQASAGWASEFYKRLYWSGNRAKVSFVSWQGSPPGGFASGGSVTDFCRDYYQAVRNALVTAPAMASAVNALPGQKTVVAHSLGNMLASSAIVHHGLTAKNYFLMNAAVPQEAYDSNDETRLRLLDGHRRPRGGEGAAFTYHPLMRHPEWDTVPGGDGYPQRALASEFHTLVPTNDSRSLMTWRGVFAGLSRLVSGVSGVPGVRNYYSPGEEVLEGSGPARDQGLQHSVLLLSELWFNQGCWMGQEWNKGFSPANWAVTTSGNRGDGGWSFRLEGLFQQRALMPWNISSDDTVLRVNPAFTRFGNDALHDAGDFTAFAAGYPAQLSSQDSQSLGHLLAAQIPALSDPAGSGETEGFMVKIPNSNERINNNKPLSSFQDDWPAPRLVQGIVNIGSRDYERRWLHSDLKAMAYRYVYRLYDDMVTAGELKAAPDSP